MFDDGIYCTRVTTSVMVIRGEDDSQHADKNEEELAAEIKENVF